MGEKPVGRAAFVGEGIGRYLLAAVLASLCCSTVFAQNPDPLDTGRQSNSPGTAPGINTVQGTAAPVPAAVEDLFDHVRFLQEEMRQLRRLLEQQGRRLNEEERRQLERYLDMDQRLGALEKKTLAADTLPESTAANAEPVSPPGERAAYQRAYGQVTSGAYDEAMVSFRAFLEQWPKGEYAANAWFWMGELHLAETPPNLAAAEQSFVRFLGDFPAHRKVPAAMFKVGKVRHLRGDLEQAKAILQRVVEEYGDTAEPAARLAKTYLARYFK